MVQNWAFNKLNNMWYKYRSLNVPTDPYQNRNLYQLVRIAATYQIFFLENLDIIYFYVSFVTWEKCTHVVILLYVYHVSTLFALSEIVFDWQVLINETKKAKKKLKVFIYMYTKYKRVSLLFICRCIFTVYLFIINPSQIKKW